MSTSELMELSGVKTRSEPFHYSIVSKTFPNRLSLEILQWLESETSWRLVKTDFYEQFVFSLLDVELPEHLSLLRDSICLRTLKLRFENLFGVNLKDQIDIVAHKLVPGQSIRIHNDFIPGSETHRFTVQLNRGLQDDWGGWFVLFNSSDPAEIHKILRPKHNTALGFAISARSYHAISPIYDGERYTLVFSLYEDHREKPSN